MTYTFDVYIHTNEMNFVPAKIVQYSLEKYNPGLTVYLYKQEQCHTLLGNHLNSFYRSGQLLQWNKTKSQSFFPVRFMCVEEHKRQNRNSRWIVVMDPDIFCIKSIRGLEAFIQRAEENHKSILACKKQQNKYNSSFMVLDTHNIDWTEETICFDIFEKHRNFDDYMFLEAFDPLELPGEYNEYDTIKSNTILFHTTMTVTQPWKTGIQYCKSDLHNNPYKPNEPMSVFQEHPNTLVKQTFFLLASESYKYQYITDTDIQTGIEKKGLRADLMRFLVNI